MLDEFKKFAMRGNFIDMAVGIMVGAAFVSIVNSFVNDVLMPPIGLLVGNVDFSDLFLDLSGVGYGTLAEAEEAGAVVIKYGMFLNSVIDFLIVAFIVFLLVKQINKMNEQKKPIPTQKTCKYCLTKIPVGATKCFACTSKV